MIMTIDMVTGEVTEDSCSQHSVGTVTVTQPEMHMPRDLEPGLQTYDNCVTHKPGSALPEGIINTSVDNFIEQMQK